MRLLSSLWLRLSLLFLLGLLLFLGINTRRQGTATVSLLPPLPQDPQIQVYFNHSPSAMYVEPYRQQRRLGDDLEAEIVDAIATAQSSIDLAVQELNLPRIAQALRERHQAGVQVRVIVENTYRTPFSSLTSQTTQSLEDRAQQKYQEFLQLVDQNRDGQITPTEAEQRDAIVILQNAGIPILDDTADGSKGSGLMHHKFVIIDRRQVIVASANFTLSDIHGDFLNPASLGNANHLLAIANPAIAQTFTQEFNLMWGDGSGGQPDSLFGVQKTYRPPQSFKLAKNSQITLQFSPTSKRLTWEQSGNGLIGKTLAQARQAVDIMLFVFSEQKLANILQSSHQRNVKIRTLIEPSFAYRDYSELLDMTGIALLNAQCRYDKENQPWRSPITTVGIPDLPQGDLLHHKVAILDQRIVITGSHNWSDAANHNNDENILIIDNPTVAAHFQREFERLYRGATLGIPESVKEKVRSQSTRCR